MKKIPIVLTLVLLILCLSGCVMLVDPNVYPVYTPATVVVTQPPYYSPPPVYVPVSPVVVYPTYPVYRTYYYGGYYYYGHPWHAHRGYRRH
jgi:hypothetical protein